MLKHAQKTGERIIAGFMMLMMIMNCGMFAPAISEGEHNWVNRTQIRAANCTEPATFQYTCSICNATKTVMEGEADPNAHEWGEWVVDAVATNTSAGSRHRTCLINVRHTQTETIPTIAIAGFNLPIGLKEIGEEAFANATYIKGLIDLPNQVEYIGKSAFAGANLFAVDIPSSVIKIEANAFAGRQSLYALVEGMSTEFATQSLSGLQYVFGYSGSTAETAADSHGINFIPLNELTIKDGFYYQLHSGSLSLICPVDNRKIGNKVTVPMEVNGEKVATVSDTAFWCCSQLSEIALPEDIEISNSAFASCPNATISYYGNELAIRSIEANVENVSLGDVITWTAEVSGGTKEYCYQYSVLQGNTRIMTSGYTEEASFSYCPKNEGTYRVQVVVDDGENTVSKKSTGSVQVTKAALRIDSISASSDSIVAGGNVIWTVKTTGGQPPLTYNYTLKKNEAQIDAISGMKSNFYSSILEEKGSYTLSVSITDQNGTNVTAVSETVLVGVKPLKIYDIALNSTIPVITGEELTWTVSAGEGTEPYSYIYTVLEDDIEMTTVASRENTFTYYGTTVSHAYTLLVECTDANGNKDSASSVPIQVFAVESVTAPAPSIQLNSTEASLSATSENAESIRMKSLNLTWQNVEGANQYEFALDAQINNQWANIWQTALTADKTKCTIPETVFEGVDEQTLCRLSVVSVALREGNPNIYYFRTLPALNPAILVDGKTTACWERTMKTEGSRTYTITSELPWSVSQKPDWIEATISGDNLILLIKENNVNSNRNGNIILANEKQTFTIPVYQGTAKSAPAITYYSNELSKDPDHPTEIPYGGFPIEIDKQGKYTHIVVSEKDSSGKYINSTDVTTNKIRYSFPDQFESLSFSNPKDIRIQVSAHYSNDKQNYSLYDGINEVEGDAPEQAYYIHMVNSGHYLSLEGMENMTVTTYDSESVKLYASNKVSVSSDSTWLDYSISDTVDSNGNGWSFKAIAEPNYTGSARTGHLTLTLGAKQAVLTVVQPDCTPKLLNLSNISTSPSSPTQLTQNSLNCNMLCSSYNWAVLENGSYVIVVEDNKEKIHEVKQNFSEYTNTIESGRKYRLTLSNPDGKTTKYYFKATNNNDYVILAYSLWDCSYEGKSISCSFVATKNWKITSNASWCTVSKTSGNSTGDSTSSFKITCQKNTSTNSREAIVTMTLTGTSISDQVTVRQAGSPSESRISVFVDNAQVQSGYTFDHLPGTKTTLNNKFKILVSTAYENNYFELTSNVAWITFSKDTSASPSMQIPSIKLAENTSGNQRTGTITLTSGTASFSLRVVQEAEIGAPEIISPTFSTDYKNPSVYNYDSGDIVVTWKKVKGAVNYDLSCSIPGKDTFIFYINDTGAATYSYSIPRSLLNLNADEYHCFSVTAYNQYGHYSSSGDDTMYFNVVPSDAVYINGSLTPLIDKVSDIGKSFSLPISSTGNWQAISNNNWIVVSNTSGVNGDQLNITVKENTGSARQGTVTVSSNGKNTTLAINQYAYLPYTIPEISSPVFSDQEGNPTILANVPDSITVKWNAHPQMNYYKITISQINYKNKGGWLPIATYSSSNNGVEQYTFNNLKLSKGLLYRCTIECKSDRWQTVSKNYYFMVSDPDASIELCSAEEPYDVKMPMEKEHWDDKILSSGQWTAFTDSDWILLYNEEVTSDLLSEKGEDYFRNLRGVEGSENFSITTLTNYGKERIGYVTIQCGGLQKQIKVTQTGYNSMATFTNSFSTSSKAPTEISKGALNLSWTKGEGGSGEYWIELYESESDTDLSYTRVFSKTTENQYISIPADKLVENRYYRLSLTTILEGHSKKDESNPTQTVFLYVGSANMLTLSATADWSQNYVGGKVFINAVVNGGSGDYLFNYYLYKGGVEVASSLGAIKYSSYDFTISEAGQYQIKIKVKDRITGKEANCYCSTANVSNDIPAQIRIDRQNWIPNAAGEALIVSVTANMPWECRGSDPWITVDKNSDTRATVRVTANNTGSNRTGFAIFNIGNVNASILISQESATPPAGNLKLNPAVWNIGGYTANTTSVFVSSSGDWTITAYPDWITPSTTNGTRGDRVSFYADPNPTEEIREADVVFTCGSETASFSVTQGSIDLHPHVEKVVFSNTNVLTGQDVTATVTVKNAVEVQLWVDGVLLRENSAEVMGSTAIISRSFSKDGDRKIKFKALREDGVGEFSEEYTINVQSCGDLDVPNIQTPGSIFVGESCDIHWSNVENAEYYHLILYYGSNEIIRWSNIKGTYKQISSDLFAKDGKYTVLVMATAEGYSQSENSAAIKVQIPTVNFAITAPKNGNSFETLNKIYLSASNPSGYKLRFKISNGNQTWFIPDEDVLTNTSITYEWTIPQRSNNADQDDSLTYQIWAVAYGSGLSSHEQYWGITPSPISISVNSGTIESLKIAGCLYYEIKGGERIAKKTDLQNIWFRTNLGVNKVDIYKNGTLLKTINASEGNLYNEWHRDFQYTDLTAINDGRYVYKFVSTDKDGYVRPTSEYEMFGYTPVSPITKYAKTKYVKLYKNPNGGEIKTLSLDDEITVIGTYQNNMYYVYLNGDNSALGFVYQNQVQNEQVIDWSKERLTVISGQKVNGEEAEIYLFNGSYSPTFVWKLSRELPKNMGYNIRLIPTEKNGNGAVYLKEVQLNTSKIASSQYEVPSEKINTMFLNVDQVFAAYVKLHVDLVDVNGNVVKAADSDEFLIFHNSEAEWILERISYNAKLAGYCHEILYTGKYELGDVKVNTGTTIKDVTNVGYWYSLVTDDIASVPATDIEKAAILAEAIMNEEASANPPQMFSSASSIISELKKVCGWLGFTPGMVAAMDELEEQIASDYLYYGRVFLGQIGGHDEEIEKEYEEWLTKAMNASDSSKLSDYFGKASDILSVAKDFLSMLQDYFKFRSVSRNNVQPYIDAFRSINTNQGNVYRYAADFLEIMTEGDQYLLTYISSGYCFTKGKDFLCSTGYKFVINLLPPDWKIAVKFGISAGKMANNALFNTKNTLEKAYHLLMFSEQTEIVYREMLKMAYELEEKSRTDMEKAYNDLRNKVNAYFKMLEFELKAFNDFADENSKGIVAKAMGMNSYQIDVNSQISWTSWGINYFLDCYYLKWVRN